MATTREAALDRRPHPPLEPPPIAAYVALAGLRILAGLLWLYNVSWKRPPDFGRSSGNGLYGFTKDAVDHPVFPPYSWVVEHLVLPNFTAFGWAVLVVETALAVLLLTGTLVRLAALVGVGESLAIGLSVAQTPGEWPWSYWMMIGIHVVLLFTAANRVAAVDGARTVAKSARRAAPALRLLVGWAVVVGVTGVVALVLGFGDDPFVSEGVRLGGSSFSVSVGSYNQAGAIVLIVVAGLMLAAAALRQRVLALVAALVALIAAATLYVQLGRFDVWLGGSNTSAGFFLCAVVVSAALSGVLGRGSASASDTREPEAARA